MKVKLLLFKYKNSLFIFVLVSFLSLELNAQHTNVMIGDSTSVSYPEEPTIALDPNNTDILLAGANIRELYVSEDGGQTWTYNELSSSLGVYGDPCIVSDNHGNFYYFHLANPEGPAFADRIICQKTTDYGETWNNGSYTEIDNTRFQDKEWACVDRGNNIIYLAWTQFDDYWPWYPDLISEDDSSIIRFSRSLDGGESWSTPVRLNKVAGDCWDEDNTTEGAVPTVGPNGEVYISWAGPEGIVFDKSLDYGQTWLEEDIFVSDIPGGWAFYVPGIMRSNGFPVTICDTSQSNYSGTIYINWSDQRNGTNDTDIWLVKSIDQGESWSDPIRVNNDVAGKHQFFNWMAVDQTNGYIYVVFYDRRNYNDTNTDVYLAVSRNGGESFDNFKISESPFVPYETIFFGDYSNIVAHNNVIRPIWTRLDYTRLSVWTALIDPDALGIDNVAQVPFSLEQNYPNPFHESTFFSFKMRFPSKITLKVYDIYGRKVCILINNEFRDRGKYVVDFNVLNYNLPSGVYYFSLVSNNNIMTREMVVRR